MLILRDNISKYLKVGDVFKADGKAYLWKNDDGDKKISIDELVTKDGRTLSRKDIENLYQARSFDLPRKVSLIAYGQKIEGTHLDFDRNGEINVIKMFKVVRDEEGRLVHVLR
jgi:hypothetical protein